MNLSVKDLKKLSFFQGLPDHVIQTLLNSIHTVPLKKGQILFHAHDAVPHIYFVFQGEVLIYNLTKHGSRKIIFLLGPGHLINHDVLDGRLSPVFCEGAGNTVLFQIPRDVFLPLMEEHTPLMHAVMHEYERNMWRMGHQLKNTAGSMLIERKIAAKLWKLGRDFGVQTPKGIMIEPELTMTMLADMVGVPRETISRACKNLTEQNLLIYQNRHFLLPDPDGLAIFYKM
ncbi:MAG: Crp/Fnr family transcriptional regulator [Clostridia bacterium]|nr:Crp/Fnr family transcriptional regulator [Clostridia bacterium]NCC43230.1 Crp/Fnr family transcriptional regulator [Clostridia bacterium]